MYPIILGSQSTRGLVATSDIVREGFCLPEASLPLRLPPSLSLLSLAEPEEVDPEKRNMALWTLKVGDSHYLPLRDS